MCYVRCAMCGVRDAMTLCDDIVLFTFVLFSLLLVVVHVYVLSLWLIAVVTL